MKRKLYYFLVCICCMFAYTANAASQNIPNLPQFDAKSYILIDAKTGKRLASKNPDARLHPASITKIMAVYVSFQSLKKGQIQLEDKVLISKKAWMMKGSLMFIEVGEYVSVHDLLKGIIIQSGNDSSVALAEHIAGTEESFVSMMNHEASTLGLSNTFYMNSSGMPDAKHYTSAADIAIISRALILNFPDLYKMFSQKEYTYNNITQRNRNRLLWLDSSVDGIKTGHTDSAGYCLATSSKVGDMRLISVVLGTKNTRSRRNITKKLLRHGHRFYKTHHLYKSGEILGTPRVWMGKEQVVSIAPDEDVFITIPTGTFDSLKTSINVSPKIIAPFPINEILGRIKITQDGVEIGNVPLLAQQAVAEGGFFRRIYDRVVLFYKNLLDE